MTDRKFHKRVITVTVLSEDVLPEGMGLDTVAEEISNGDYSGEVSWGPDQEINGKRMARLLEGQGSDPAFFQLDDKGNDLED